jgi:hypothetical protein
MGERPLWRQVYDQVDHTVTPPLERLVRTPEFAEVTAMAMRVRARLRDRVRGATARVWHLMNLPAGTDVQHLHVQIGALDREVRRLRLQLARQIERLPHDVPAAREVDGHLEEPAEKGTQHAHSSGSDSGAGPRAPRPAAQRRPRT